MGDFSDSGEDQGIGAIYRADETLWRTQNGLLLKIANMGNQHLLNAIAHCERNGQPRIAAPLVAEARKRGILTHSLEGVVG